MILWHIWKWRNLACLEGRYYIPQERPAFLLGRFEEVLWALHIDGNWPDDRKGGKSEINVSWERPVEGWVILNTDGAARCHGPL